MLGLPPDSPIATSDELAAVWPGGRSNRYEGIDAWVWCFAQLTGFARRLEARDAAQHSDEKEDRVRAVIAAAQRAQPESVTLADGSTRAVYPKGIWALSYLEALGHVTAGVLTALVGLVAAGTELEQLVELQLTQTKAVRVWAWILATPGASVPWPDGATELDLPDWTSTLTPQDLLAIDLAHRKVHGERMAIMAHLFPPEPGETSRLAIGGMLAAYQYDKGLTQDAMRLLSVGEVVAGAVATAEAYRLAKHNADAKRGRA